MLQNDPDVNPWHPDSSRNRRGSNMLRNPNQMQQIPRGVQQATIDAKYGKKNSSYRAGTPVRQAPAMILPEERSPEMIQEEEDTMDA